MLFSQIVIEGKMVFQYPIWGGQGLLGKEIEVNYLYLHNSQIQL